MNYPANYADPTPEGLGAPIFWWAILVDEQAVNTSTYTREAVLDQVLRWDPAHTKGWLCLYSSNAGGHVAYGVFDDPTNGYFDLCLFQ